METGYNFNVKINKIDSIKPRQAGEFIDNTGKERQYGHAVKFKSRNVALVPDEDYGEKEVETTVEIEITCDTMVETVSLNNHLKELKKIGKPFTMDVSAPSLNNGIYTAKSTIKGREFKEAHKIK